MHRYGWKNKEATRVAHSATEQRAARAHVGHGGTTSMALELAMKKAVDSPPAPAPACRGMVPSIAD